MPKVVVPPPALHRLRLSTADLAMLVEVLDCFLPFPGDDSHWGDMSAEEYAKWEPYRLLRMRLHGPKPGGVVTALRWERKRQAEPPKRKRRTAK